MERSKFIKELSKLNPQQLNNLIQTKGKESRKIQPFVYINKEDNKKLNTKSN